MVNRYSSFEFFDTNKNFLPERVAEALRQESIYFNSDDYLSKKSNSGESYFLDTIYYLYQSIAERVNWHLHWDEDETRPFAVGDLIRDGEFFTAIGDLILEIGYQAGGFKEFLPPRYINRVKGFEPVADQNAKILILGTMPGITSLRLNQYYAAPRNQFWKILDNINEGYLEAKYQNRIQKLKIDKIALWDVLNSAERDGSLDANIDGNTIIVNEFQPFFDDHKNIHTVFFNGMKAFDLFQKHVIPQLSSDTIQRLKFISLPSTSSANTHQTLAEKVKEWKAIFKC